MTARRPVATANWKMEMTIVESLTYVGRFQVQVGALLGGADAEEVERLKIFGERIGIAFQITDDLLDLSSSNEVIGKTTGKDLSLGKATLPLLIGFEQAELMARNIISEAIVTLGNLKGRYSTLLALADRLINRDR